MARKWTATILAICIAVMSGCDKREGSLPKLHYRQGTTEKLFEKDMQVEYRMHIEEGRMKGYISSILLMEVPEIHFQNLLKKPRTSASQ